MEYEIISKNPYNGKELIESVKGILIKGPWKEEYKAIIVDNQIRSIFLNIAKGWECESYSFLKDIPEMLEIDIIDSNDKDIHSVESQLSLKSLSLNMPIGSIIDLSIMGQLEECYIVWNKNVNSIFDAISLKRLYIDNFKAKDDHRLKNLKNLKELTVANSNMTSLEFLNSLKDTIQTLELLNCKKIVDFIPITMLNGLKKLNIDGYKDIRSIEFIKGLENLEILLLNVGRIDSIEPLLELKRLKALSFFGTSTYIEDGNLQPLTSIKELSMLMLVDRKHYTHKVVKPWNWKHFGIPDKLLVKKG